MKFLTKPTQILLAGFTINLCLGILYAWSIFKKALVSDLQWSNADASLPYTAAIITFSLALLIAGILQDKFGPKPILITGTVMVGIGMISASFALTPTLLLITFGGLVGSGIGFGYACLSPAAMKWFSPTKKGVVNGIIAAGFGLAAVYLAPLTTHLIAEFGIQSSFRLLGIGVLLIATPLAFTINNPKTPIKYEKKAGTLVVKDLSWKAMIKTPKFYGLWCMYALASAAGLMIIGNITSIAALQANITDAAYLVAILAIFNSGGRVAAGILSDKIGGLKTLFIAFLLQGANMMLFAIYQDSFTLMIGAAITGIGYGTLLAVFPSLITDYYGLKNYGANYGVLYTAWGVSGVIGPIIAAITVDTTGNYQLAYMLCAGMVIAAGTISLLMQMNLAFLSKKSA